MTLKETMSAQEVFDYVAVQLMTQGRHSTRANSSELLSFYRGDFGTKCPGGMLMTDDEYDSSFEYHELDLLMNFQTVDGPALPQRIRDNIELVLDLQELHDTEPVEMWKSILYYVAHKHQLSNNILNKLRYYDTTIR